MTAHDYTPPMHVLSIDRDFRANFGRAARLSRSIGRTELLTDSATYQICVAIRELVTKN